MGNIKIIEVILQLNRMFEQTERSFHKQLGVSAWARNQKSVRWIPGKHGLRWYKNVGLGFTTPRPAIEGTYIDKKCPFTSNVSIRGRILKGVVKSTRMKRTIVVRRNYLHYIKKYHRYEKRHSNISAHLSPCFRCKEGDEVSLVSVDHFPRPSAL